MKDFLSKWKVKLFFFEAPTGCYRNRDCWTFGNHRRRV